jgi:hypothetical protein
VEIGDLESWILYQRSQFLNNDLKKLSFLEMCDIRMWRRQICAASCFFH